MIEKKLKEALTRAYVPYSNFRVAAVIELADGTIISGNNVENASYPLTICAERVALTSLIAQGYSPKDIKKMYIYNDQSKISPCGACRQVMSELMEPNVPIVLTDLKGFEQTVLNKELLPFPFGGKK